MEEGKKVTTLSDKGYVDSTKTILARLLSYYILTDNEQSFCFRSKLISLTKSYYEHINDPEGFKNKVASDLELLLGKYFERVVVETEVRYNDTESKADIGLYADVIDKYNKRVGLGKVVSIDPSGLGNVIDVNNFGEAKRLIRR